MLTERTRHNINPVELAKLTDLQLLARTVVQGVLTGLHRSPHSGTSIEFSQYRPYAQGDDPRLIDWRLYGRTDRVYIKQFQDETTLRCTLLLDCSASMDYTSGSVTKFHYARMLVACLAMLLHKQNDAAGFIAYHHELIQYIPPRSGATQLKRIFVELDNLHSEGQTDTAQALHYLGDVLRPRGMVVLVTDLLHPVDEVIDHLASLRARRHDLIVLQISDPAEETFPFKHSATFIDAESGKEQYAVPSTVRNEYLKNRAKHFDKIRAECLSSEIEIQEFSTSDPLDKALGYFLQRRTNALTTSSPRSRGSGGGSRR